MVTASDKAMERPLGRRELLRRAVYMVGGAAAVAALEGCSGNEEPTPLDLSGPRGRYFSPLQMTQLRAVVDVLIPETDTPGGLGAGVPDFLDAMMVDWASEDTRGQMVRVLNEIDERSIGFRQKSFLRLSPEDRLALMQGYDAAGFEKGNYPYRRFKDLVLLGYYHSEIGATQELQYELIPGRWEACIPLDGMRAWAD